MVVTRYGNTYTDEEWQEMMAIWDEEVAEANDHLLKTYAVIRIAGKMLETLGVSGNTYGIAHRILENGLDGIEFSSEEKRDAVEKITDWMETAIS